MTLHLNTIKSRHLNAIKQSRLVAGSDCFFSFAKRMISSPKIPYLTLPPVESKVRSLKKFPPKSLCPDIGVGCNMETEGSFRVRSKESSFDDSKEILSRPRPPPYSPPCPVNSEGVDIMFWAAVFLSQVVGLTSVVLIGYWCTLYGGFAWDSNAELQFFFHPLLMVLGLIFFYGDAIIVYRVLYFVPKWILKIVHAALHVIAIIMSSVGLAAVFENHRRTNKADLYSLHSWVGIGTFGFFCLQYIGGFITFMFPGIPLSLRAKIMPYHTFFGLALFIMAVGTAEMGLTERLLWTGNYTSGKYVKAGTVGNCAGLFLVIFAILVAFVTTSAKYKRKPLPSETTAPTN